MAIYASIKKKSSISAAVNAFKCVNAHIEPNSTTEAQIQPSEQINACVNNFPTNYINSIEEGGGNISVAREGKEVTITNFTYVHEQGIASDTWVIKHNLNKFPSVTVVDSAGTQFYAAVRYEDENNCTVKMKGACKGRAFLN